MRYKLTMSEGITNAGANQTVKEFDTFNELQDYYMEYMENMDPYDRELLNYNSRIEEVDSEEVEL